VLEQQLAERRAYRRRNVNGIDAWQDRAKITVEVKMSSTDWMDRESARIANAKRLAEDLGRRQLEESMAAQQGAPEYWNEFVGEVKMQTEDLEKKFTKPGFIDEKIVGYSAVEEPSAILRDHSCTIIVNRYSVRSGPESCELYFYYQPGATQIKRSARDQRDVFIDLQVGPQGVMANVDGSSMTAKQLAAYIVREMYERVRFPE
jgi:hypothetical protein